jgi:chaperonin GroES
MSNIESFKGTKHDIDPTSLHLAAQRQEHGGLCIVQAVLEEKTKGGIVIPDANKKPAQKFSVYAVGPTDRKHLEAIVSGQTVYVHGWARPELWFKWKGDLFAIVRLEDIEAIVSEDGALNPIGERLVVRPKWSEEKTASGIYIPETVMERPQIGVVLVAGPGSWDIDGTFLPVKAEAGQEVLYGRYCGATVKQDGAEVLIIHQEDVLGVIIQRGAEHGNEGQAGDAGCTGGRCFPVGADCGTA